MGGSSGTCSGSGSVLASKHSTQHPEPSCVTQQQCGPTCRPHIGHFNRLYGLCLHTAQAALAMLATCGGVGSTSLRINHQMLTRLDVSMSTPVLVNNHSYVHIYARLSNRFTAFACAPKHWAKGSQVHDAHIQYHITVRAQCLHTEPLGGRLT